jgi:hypothetical protein
VHEEDQIIVNKVEEIREEEEKVWERVKAKGVKRVFLMN